MSKIMLILRISAFALLAFVTQASAQADGPDALHGDPSAGLAAAFDDLARGSFTDALVAAARDGQAAEDVIQWLRLRERKGDFATAADFLRRNPDWPGIDYLRTQSERHLPDAVPDDATARAIVDFFDGAEPQTGQGTVALVRAYRHLGREGDAQAQAALAWVGRSLTGASESVLLAMYPDDLATLEPARMDQMYWDGSDDALRRAMARDPEGARLIAARQRARTAGLPDDFPQAWKTDGGVLHGQFRRALAQKDRAGAIDILLRASVSEKSLGRPDAWARTRRDLARERMRDGDHATAYAIASSHWLVEGASFADLEWLSGYLALRFLDQPERAAAHFRRFADGVDTPISLGRAGYWIGRAEEALGHEAAAAEGYAIGAAYQTSYYGLLAAERLGLPLDPSLTGRQTYPPFAEAPFLGSSVLEAGLLLQSIGERDLAERFLTHLSESLDEEAVGTLAEHLLDLGEPHIALLIAKRAAQRGMTLPRPYFPVVEVGVENMPVEPALALSIARRESEFDPGVSSGVGARGLMQLMPGTAREVAGALNMPYQATRLFSDPSYNATLGTAYLAGLIQRFGDNPVLVSSGYNAGPGRPAQWIRRNGDPREPGVDVIDWIEMIPFDETRNYAMRVAESIPVYRARLTGETGPLEFTRMLKGR